MPIQAQSSGAAAEKRGLRKVAADPRSAGGHFPQITSWPLTTLLLICLWGGEAAPSCTQTGWCQRGLVAFDPGVAYLPTGIGLILHSPQTPLTAGIAIISSTALIRES
jgi:hypothetical protein